MRASMAFAALLALTVPSFAAPPPAVVNANDGIFSAFQTHSLVGIGEWHGLAQELDYYQTLVRDPRFAEQVGNIVLETGSASQQATVDRYVNGEDVPYAQLRKVWSDVVGWVPTVPNIANANLYATIRAVNATLPPDRRIKVWLGEPAIDWSQISSKAQWQAIADQRESHAASLIKHEILDKGRKALVVYGIGHFGLYPGYDNVRTMIAATYPDAWYLVAPYVGYFQKACAARFERRTRTWPMPALASPVSGSSLGQDLVRPGCSPFDAAKVPPAALVLSNRNNYGLTSDALLYLGPRASLLKAGLLPDLYLDSDFRAELDRRNRIMTGKPLAAFSVDRNPAVPNPWE